ncbi:MAG: acriflavine resistance protein B [Omnitrophica WOR_2 bacterium RIFOXYB2_FULL_38_16]|nr:MAG: acriflavine resistance protein B [Omnitrophica WOR_2 bacterium RIFOXYA2_FULL_38_17]OGX56780.1 MAG: acriflavine resistance protein B [Omnitrophica WOR_2 bacterium RIFOXYC2_FULL_38_12]OGX57858.1 MAG: acriflavine resistance protein B [Omnitrophica WOR_2 bacterium RIFOXYB2_FULL_38_16]HBG62485.1 acriflavine resistance protein B [Candidatus Omnitrophota bacterium]
MLNNLIKYFLENKLVTALFVIGIILWGIAVMPFETGKIESLMPRDPVPVDAIPDIGENQQIVFTEWMGRSPQDMEDQVTYPLAISLQGIPGVKSIRSYSAFGFSSIFVIFNEGVDFYWSRSRLLERLSSAQKDLPDGVIPVIGPDATALGQIFWYTLEGEGFSLDELRSIQDWYVKYSLQSAEGISEVASVGGYVKEYQIDVDPDAMRAYGVGLQDIMMAVKRANIDVGAKTIEFNRAEYVVRGIGFVKSLEDIENIIIKTNENVPIYVKNVASQVNFGPALRRGALDKQGAEAVGGIVVVRYGGNPMEAIKNVKKKIDQIEQGLPTKILPDGKVSKVRIVPFYDRTRLIKETLGTLSEALTQEILITIIVILVFLMHLRSSLVISFTLPIAVLMAFIMMKVFKVDANIMSLAGIAIAIGTIVDMGIIMCENIINHLKEAKEGESPLAVVYRGASEVGGAILTAISTTIVSFLAVFTMTGPEGKLFKPLAFTKSFALLASVIIALLIVPALAHIFFVKRKKTLEGIKQKFKVIIAAVAAFVGFKVSLILGFGILVYSFYLIFENRIPAWIKDLFLKYSNWIAIGLVGIFLTNYWMPLGFGKGFILNLLFVGSLLSGLMVFFFKFMKFYPNILMYFLSRKRLFMMIPLSICIFGMTIWLGFAKVISPITGTLGSIGIKESSVLRIWPASFLHHAFPGLGKEFMPPLDEGSYLYMPTIMPHASIGEALDVLQKQDILIGQIPEVESVVGKLGRTESPLDMAPISMIETVISYKPEYGEKDLKTGKRPRLWRSHIKTPDDIWKEILKAGDIPGATSAPKLQPIAARIVMLQSGMRAPMGVKVLGKSLQEIEDVGFQIEKFLKDVPGVEPSAVIADRIVGKPYIEFNIDREKIARYGINIRDVQDVIEVAIGGAKLTTTVEGRERYPVRARYPRELRDSIEDLQDVLIPTKTGAQIPLSQVAVLKFVRGPQMIKSEDTFLVGYVLFDKKPDVAEVNVVHAAGNYLQSKIDSGELVLPPGTSYKFAGNYENQVRSEKKLAVVLPLSLFIIFIILYFQFKRVTTTFLVFSGIAVAFCGGFILIWLYAQDWFMHLPFFGHYFRDVFNMQTYNLSVAVWVGFLALFGIASDDGVVVATYLEQSFAERKPKTIPEIREATLFAGQRRVRPCLMTTATTILALLPILTSTGRGSDVMVPMALPAVGGMSIELITLFMVPIGYCWLKERELEKFKVSEK